MIRTISPLALVLTVGFLYALPAQAQDERMNFFLTSVGPGNGADLAEIREPITDEDGTVLGTLVTMACRVCGYRWENES